MPCRYGYWLEFYYNAIKNFSDSSFFIRFGSDCEILSLSGNCLNDSKSYSKYCTCGGANFYCDDVNIFNETGGSTYFKVENFEVFQVC